MGPQVLKSKRTFASEATFRLVHGTSTTAATTKPPSSSTRQFTSDSNTTVILGDGWIQNNFAETLAKDQDDFNVLPVSKTNPITDGTSTNMKGFPFGWMVGMDEIKQAMILAATNSRIGGIILSGRRGSGKSVVARAVRRLLLPSIQRIRNSLYNIDPTGNEGIDSILQKELIEKGITVQDLETETIPIPFVEVPLNVMEDSLLGSIDLERSLETGQTIFSPGLLARAHRGVLYVDEINLLDEETVNFLLTVLADGYVRIEREGLSVTYPCRPRVFLATYNPIEGEIREHLLDRIGLSLVTNDLTLEERIKATELVLGYMGDTQFQETTLKNFECTETEEQEIRDTIENARQLLGQVQMSESQILYICQEATRAGCEGQRAEIFATEVARTSAALAGRTKVNAKDLQMAVLLAIAPRATILPQDFLDETTSEGQAQQQQPTSPSPLQPLPEVPPPQEEPTAETSDEDEQSEEENDEDEEELEEIEIPLEFMFGVTETPIDPRLMYFNRWTRKGKGRKGSRRFNLERGRFIKAIFPKTRKGKLAVAATLRAGELLIFVFCSSSCFDGFIFAHLRIIFHLEKSQSLH
jgi:magnesium chelatase subunit D